MGGSTTGQMGWQLKRIFCTSLYIINISINLFYPFVFYEINYFRITFLHFLQDSLLLFPWITTKIEGYTMYVLIQDRLLIICVEEYLLISNYINYYFLSKHRAQTLSSGFGK